ncbi:MAG TPA: Mut7-C RNAse domain-containing protein [Myxococcaceae bacterium]|nr:Mut7-C RNAse domain-containing protein [Myxococcaceae bacterium]
MARARFRFVGELNDHLPRERRDQWFDHEVRGAPSMKDTIEALGVPHPEVDLILVDGRPAPFEAALQEGVEVEVFPSGIASAVAPTQRLSPEPQPVARFVLDGHLGGLAGLLRMLGFDTWWSSAAHDEELATRSAHEDRTLLTRDRGLLKRSLVRRGRFVRALDPMDQAREILERFDLRQQARPFTRCLRCNAVLEPAQAEQIAQAVPRGVHQRHAKFHACPGCGRVYWAGSHHTRMKGRVAELLRRSG